MALRDGNHRYNNLRESTAGGAGPLPLSLTVESQRPAKDAPQTAAEAPALPCPGAPGSTVHHYGPHAVGAQWQLTLSHSPGTLPPYSVK